MSVKVVATGVFDIIHIGHAHFLNAAKKHGDSFAHAGKERLREPNSKKRK